MPNKVIPSTHFIAKLKRLLKKYPSLRSTLIDAEKELLMNPRIGSSYGQNIYKLRIPGEGKGKSGGYRVITYVLDITEQNAEIHLVTIFTKAEDSTITKVDAVDLIKKIYG